MQLRPVDYSLDGQSFLGLLADGSRGARAGHSYTNPAIDALGMIGFSYDERADRRSWTSMRHLLEEAL